MRVAWSYVTEAMVVLSFTGRNVPDDPSKGGVVRLRRSISGLNHYRSRLPATLPAPPTLVSPLRPDFGIGSITLTPRPPASRPPPTHPANPRISPHPATPAR
ncbi:hypothetical protein GCM10010502_44530 [Kitasatospora aureofaciens]|uniref:Uncharacterized protein n=1 Tax=Kitasatospora aureofaciens TaxID=1894 RepID=A0A8H9LUF8_KITAU|nr:hypothetical protein GCM10010502_44530 [Kitasatospora aureofaciens]